MNADDTPKEKRHRENAVIVTEEDCLPEHSAGIYAIPGWDNLGAAGRAAVTLRSLGWMPEYVEEVTGVTEKEQMTLHNAIGPERRRRLTKRDILALEYLQFKQLQEAALRYITPQKLMATSAFALAKMAATNADKARDIMAQMMELDDAHPEDAGETEDPLEALQRVREEG